MWGSEGGAVAMRILLAGTSSGCLRFHSREITEPARLRDGSVAGSHAEKKSEPNMLDMCRAKEVVRAGNTLTQEGMQTTAQTHNCTYILKRQSVLIPKQINVHTQTSSDESTHQDPQGPAQGSWEKSLALLQTQPSNGSYRSSSHARNTTDTP